MPFDPFQRPGFLAESLEAQSYADIFTHSQARWEEGALASSLTLLLPCPGSSSPVTPPTLPALLSSSATEVGRATQRQLIALLKSRTECLRVALEGALGVSQPPWAMSGSKQVHHLTLSSLVPLAPSTPTPVPLHAVLEAYQLVCPGVGEGVILATLLPTLREWLWRVAQGGGGGIGTVSKPSSVVLEMYCNPPPPQPSSNTIPLDIPAVFKGLVQLCSTLPTFFAASPTLTPSLTTLLLLGGSGSGSGSKQQQQQQSLPLPRLLDALADTIPLTYPPSSQTSPQDGGGAWATLGAALHIYDRAVWDASAHLLSIALHRDTASSSSLPPLEGEALKWWGAVSGLTEALCSGMKDVTAAAAAGAGAGAADVVPSFTTTSLLPRVGLILRSAALLEGKACMDAQGSTRLPVNDATWRVLCASSGGDDGAADGKEGMGEVVGEEEEDTILSLLPRDFPHIHTSINPTSPWLMELLRVVPNPHLHHPQAPLPPTDFLSWALTSFSSSPSSTSSPNFITPCAHNLWRVIQCLQAVAATTPSALDLRDFDAGGAGVPASVPPSVAIPASAAAASQRSATQAILATTSCDIARLYVAVEGGAFPLHHRPFYGGHHHHHQQQQHTPQPTSLSMGLKEWGRVSSRLLASHNDAAYLAHALTGEGGQGGAAAAVSASCSVDRGRAMELLRMFAQKALVVALSQQRERVHAIFNGSSSPSAAPTFATGGGVGGGGEKPPMEAHLLTTAKAVGEVIFTTATVCQPLLPPSLLHPFLINLCDVSLERVIRTILAAVEEGEGGGGGGRGGGDEDEDEEDGGVPHHPHHRASSSYRLTPPKPPPFASALAHIMAVTQWAFKHGSSSSTTTSSSGTSSSPWVAIRSWERARAMLYLMTMGGRSGDKDEGQQALIDRGGLSAEEIKGVRELRSS